MYPSAVDIKGNDTDDAGSFAQLTPSAPSLTPGNVTPVQQQQQRPYEVVYNVNNVNSGNEVQNLNNSGNNMLNNEQAQRNNYNNVNSGNNFLNPAQHSGYNNLPNGEHDETLMELFKQKKFMSCLGCLSCMCGCCLPNTLWPCLCILGRRSWFSHRTNKWLTVFSIGAVLIGVATIMSRIVMTMLVARAVPVCYHTDRNLCTSCVAMSSEDKNPFSRTNLPYGKKDKKIPYEYMLDTFVSRPYDKEEGFFKSMFDRYDMLLAGGQDTFWFAGRRDDPFTNDDDEDDDFKFDSKKDWPQEWSKEKVHKAKKLAHSHMLKENKRNRSLQKLPNNKHHFGKKGKKHLERRHHMRHHTGENEWFFHPGSVESCIAGPGPMKQSFLQDEKNIKCFQSLENQISELPKNQHCPYIGLDGIDMVGNEIMCTNIETNITNGIDADQSKCLPRPSYRNVAGFIKYVGTEIQHAIDNEAAKDDDDDENSEEVNALKKQILSKLAGHNEIQKNIGNEIGKNIEQEINKRMLEKKMEDLKKGRKDRKKAITHMDMMMSKKHKKRPCHHHGKHHHNKGGKRPCHHHGKDHEHEGKDVPKVKPLITFQEPKWLWNPVMDKSEDVFFSYKDEDNSESDEEDEESDDEDESESDASDESDDEEESEKNKGYDMNLVEKKQQKQKQQQQQKDKMEIMKVPARSGLVASKASVTVNQTTVTDDALYVYMCPPHEYGNPSCDEICECLGGYYIELSPFVKPFLIPLGGMMSILIGLLVILKTHFQTLRKADTIGMQLPTWMNFRDACGRRRSNNISNNNSHMYNNSLNNQGDVPLLQVSPIPIAQVSSSSYLQQQPSAFTAAAPAQQQTMA